MSWFDTYVKRYREGDSYKLSILVVRAGGLPVELFVYRADTQQFSHPATADDLVRVPAGLTEGSDFYRTTSVLLSFPSAKHAVAADNLIHERLVVLRQRWDAESPNTYALEQTRTYSQ